jgi:ribosome-associated toxin RatA of RatAB toxin-antitoxin module
MDVNVYEVSAERRFQASPERVYNLIIDMEEHRRILPKQFESLDVLEGGRGAGTVFRLTMKVMGSRTSLVMTLSEPEPGRIVQEQDPSAGVTTIWKLIPMPGDGCMLRLTSRFPSKPGFSGWVERLATTSMIRSIYKRELENMNEYLTTGSVKKRQSHRERDH